LVALNKKFREVDTPVRFKVHTKKSYLIYQINVSVLVIELDAIKEDWILIKKNIATMKISMNIATKSQVNSVLDSSNMRLQEFITPLDRTFDTISGIPVEVLPHQR
jgi:hypothetical protein